MTTALNYRKPIGKSTYYEMKRRTKQMSSYGMRNKADQLRFNKVNEFVSINNIKNDQVVLNPWNISVKTNRRENLMGKS